MCMCMHDNKMKGHIALKSFGQQPNVCLNITRKNNMPKYAEPARERGSCKRAAKERMMPCRALIHESCHKNLSQTCERGQTVALTHLHNKHAHTTLLYDRAGFP